MESKGSMEHQAIFGIPNSGNKRRQSLSQADVRAIFACVNDNEPPPDDSSFRIIVVPKFGGDRGMRLSPPPYEYQDGVYVLLRLHVAIPSILSDRVLLHRHLALIPECPWSLSGPQYSGESVDLQQRYCTPKGKVEEYCNNTKGAIWTMVNSDGKENFDCRVFHVYHSSKRSVHNDGSPKQIGGSPKVNRRGQPKQPSPNALMPDPDTQKSNAQVDASEADNALSPNNIGSASGTSDKDSDALHTKPKRQRQKQLTEASKKSNKKIDTSTGKPRQTTRGWSKWEDRKLEKLVESEPDVERISWNVLAFRMENRSGKQCRERYVNHLKPDRKKGKWTEQEDNLIIRLQAMWGNQWSKIAAALSGRSDNDVKNRWHSRMRSQKRKHAKISSDRSSKWGAKEKSNNATSKPRSRKQSKVAPAKDCPSQQNLDTETPKVGQRVQVKFDAKSYEGTITKVSQSFNSNQEQRYNVMIHYDDGSSEETPFPDKEVHLVPMSHELSENEVMLCTELVNLHNALKNPDKAARTKNQGSEEESPISDDHLSKYSQKGGGSSLRCGIDSCGIDAKGSAAEGSDMKPPASGQDEKDSIKAPAEISLQASLSNIDFQSPKSDEKLQSSKSYEKLQESFSTNDGAAFSSVSPPAMVSQGEMPYRCPSSAPNFQAPAFRNTPAPFFNLPNQLQQQLLAAAQLLSSVNPGLAVTAISQARHFHNLGMSHQGHASSVFFPRLHYYNGLPMNFQPLSSPSFRREMNQNDEPTAARPPALPSLPQKQKTSNASDT